MGASVTSKSGSGCTFLSGAKGRSGLACCGCTLGAGGGAKGATNWYSGASGTVGFGSVGVTTRPSGPSITDGWITPPVVAVDFSYPR